MDTDGSIWAFQNFLPSFALTTANSTATNNNGNIWLILLLIFLLACSAYFSATESSISAMNRIRMKAKADDGDKRAKNAMFVSNNFERAISTLLIGNNIVNIAIASIVTILMTRLIPSDPDKATLWSTVFATTVVFFFGEVIPKNFALDKSETTARFSSGFLRFLMKLLLPLSCVFTWLSNGVNKLVSHFIKKEEEPTITEEELYDIIETIEEEGVMDEEQGDLFKSALDFSETRAKDVMTMREDVCALDVSLSNEQILNIINETTHTRLPVYEEDVDHIIGILQIRTFIREYLKNPNVDIRTLLIPSFHVSPSALIDDLLSEMRQHKFYLGVVSDDEGRTLGLVTIEDFLEELVGEIWDEDDVVDDDFVKLGGNRFRINTHLTIGETFERIGVPCPDPKAVGRPLLSILLEHFGRIPEEEETCSYHNLELTVDSVEGTKLLTVVAHLLTEEDLQEIANAGEQAEADAPAQDTI